jgi:hypothetical protein
MLKQALLASAALLLLSSTAFGCSYHQMSVSNDAAPPPVAQATPVPQDATVQPADVAVADQPPAVLPDAQ